MGRWPLWGGRPLWGVGNCGGEVAAVAGGHCEEVATVAGMADVGRWPLCGGVC